MTIDRVWQCPLCDHTQQYWYELDTTSHSKSGWEWPPHTIIVAGHYLDHHPEHVTIHGMQHSWWAEYPGVKPNHSRGVR